MYSQFKDSILMPRHIPVFDIHDLYLIYVCCRSVRRRWQWQRRIVIAWTLRYVCVFYTSDCTCSPPPPSPFFLYFDFAIARKSAVLYVQFKSKHRFTPSLCCSYCFTPTLQYAAKWYLFFHSSTARQDALAGMNLKEILAAYFLKCTFMCCWEH